MQQDPIAIIRTIIDGTVEGGGPPPYIDGMGLEGMVFTAVEKGRFTLEWTPEMHHCQYDGLVQGGVVNVIADTGQSFAFWSTAQGDESYSTAEFSTRFFRPIKVGDTMIVESDVLNRSRRLGVIESTFVHAETGKLHAKVTGSWMLAKRDFGES
ncbi:PaaI family thioesterase [Parasphingopyxis algicola]|uniref:PaaI family thioesterase n=1 Tax=Parasphingopyxis algicola TaxID=2026624 RepID=UPI0015A4A3A9|nr:PaaI family thioesterase [Parasphingopyxis algicola]QLC25339.1 PaaI family thioesterase [Parasphingopyxis algicola]